MGMRLSNHFRGQVLIRAIQRCGGTVPKREKLLNVRIRGLILWGFKKKTLENAFIHLKIGITTLASSHLCICNAYKSTKAPTKLRAWSILADVQQTLAG